MPKTFIREKEKNGITITERLVTDAVYLYKIAFANAARKSGASVRYCGQHSLIWNGASGFANQNWEGVCSGLSIEWIKARVAGTDLLDRLDSARTQIMSVKAHELGPNVKALSKAVETSHQFQGKGAIPKGQPRIAAALKGSCVPVGDEVPCGYNFGRLKLTKGRYYYFSTGGHAMAAYCEGPTSRFYDPNVGEMQGVTTSVLANYFKETVEQTNTLLGKPKSACAEKTLMVYAFELIGASASGGAGASSGAGSLMQRLRQRLP